MACWCSSSVSGSRAWVKRSVSFIGPERNRPRDRVGCARVAAVDLGSAGDGASAPRTVPARAAARGGGGREGRGGTERGGGRAGDGVPAAARCGGGGAGGEAHRVQ